MNKHLATVSGLLVGSFVMAGCGASAPPSSAPHLTETFNPSASTSATLKVSDPPSAITVPRGSPMATSSAHPSAMVITLDMVSARQGWAINGKGQVLQTTDGGHRWRNVASRALTRALMPMAGGGPVVAGYLVESGTAVAFPNAWTAWLTVPRGNNTIQVWHTADGGHDWTETMLHPAVPAGLGLTHMAAVGNRDAWIVAASQGLAGHVDIRVWRTSVQRPGWHAIFDGALSATAGLAFATDSIGVLAGGRNIADGPHSASLIVTADGGDRWSSPRSPLPLLAGNWSTIVMDPAIVAHTREMVVPVVMQRAFPSKSSPTKAWWRLERSTNGGQTWQMLPHTPDAILPQQPGVIFQGWITPQNGWVVLGSHLYRTSDGGYAWATSTLPAGTVVNFNRVSATVGFALIQQNDHTAIYRTEDAGVRWTRVL